ncbi:MAG: hypothetical protein EBY21_14700 [Alphaproteobacteria bacterium]|nr:hypothetical protein [Alphaproteobacteria bacterium]
MKFLTYIGQMINSFHESYCTYHSTRTSLLQRIGVVGCIAFPMFYLIRLTGRLPSRYDDLELRVVATILCLLLALRNKWPVKFRPFYLTYSYATVFFCLSFMLSFTMLENRAATNSIINMFIGAILVILLTDWRNTIAMLVLGYALSFSIYWATNPDPRVPIEFLFWWVPLCTLLVAGGSLAKLSDRQAELERMRIAYTALAGSIAHEMRNPLGQIKFSLDSIKHALPIPTTRVSADAPSVSLAELNTLYNHLAQGEAAIARGLQIISMTLDEVSGKPIDQASFEYLEAGKITQKAVEEYGFDTPGERAKVSVQVKHDFTFKANETVYIRHHMRFSAGPVH